MSCNFFQICNLFPPPGEVREGQKKKKKERKRMTLSRGGGGGRLFLSHFSKIIIKILFCISVFFIYSLFCSCSSLLSSCLFIIIIIIIVFLPNLPFSFHFLPFSCSCLWILFQRHLTTSFVSSKEYVLLLMVIGMIFFQMYQQVCVCVWKGRQK